MGNFNESSAPSLDLGVPHGCGEHGCSCYGRCGHHGEKYAWCRTPQGCGIKAGLGYWWDCCEDPRIVKRARVCCHCDDKDDDEDLMRCIVDQPGGWRLEPEKLCNAHIGASIQQCVIEYIDRRGAHRTKLGDCPHPSSSIPWFW